MLRTQIHGHVAFRMLGHKGRSAAAALERHPPDPGTKSQEAANEMQGLLQKLVFFFRQDAATGKYVAREVPPPPRMALPYTEASATGVG